jgi:hypothetical protein
MSWTTIKKWVFWIILIPLLQACGGKAENPQTSDLCSSPPDIALVDIQSVVDWINAMEKPLTLPCFIQSLPRPLRIQPAYSEFSAQPSPNAGSPRIFFFFDRLILTVAVDQDFAEMPYPLLEMSYLVDEPNLITTKAELKFPIVETLSAGSPYLDLSFNERISQCSFCHPRESIRETIEDQPVYQSTMLRPARPQPVERLYQENIACEASREPHRCAMLASIVDHGELVPFQFPAGAPTIFDN